MLGAAIVVIVMVLLGPVALFVAGALWSVLVGNQLSDRVPPTPQRD